MVHLEDWHPNYWIVVINPDLSPSRTEKDFKKEGIIAFFGLDFSEDQFVEKLTYVFYPKSEYSREYVESVILPQYDECPLCKIGRNINFINKKNDNNKYKNKLKLNDVKMAFRDIFAKVSDRYYPYIGDALATGAKLAVPNALADTVIGGIITIINEYLVSKKGRSSMTDIIRELGSNLLFEYPAKLVRGGRSYGFSSTFQNVPEDVNQLINQIRSKVNLGGFKGFSDVFARLRTRTLPETLPEVSKELITSYSSESVKDIIDY